MGVALLEGSNNKTYICIDGNKEAGPNGPDVSTLKNHTVTLISSLMGGLSLKQM